MRYDGLINDSRDVVNRDYVDALIASLDSKTLAEIEAAIARIDTREYWEEMVETIIVTPEEAKSAIDNAAEGAIVSIPIGEITDDLTLNKSIVLEGFNTGKPQNYKQEV